MAEVPMQISGVLYDKKNKTSQNVVLIGFASRTDVSVGGGPIIPPDTAPPVKPPLVIWGGPFDPPHVEHPIVLPDPPVPPETQPPSGSTTDNVHPGWNFNDGKNPQYPNTGWYYVYIPGPTDAQPKKK